MSLGTHIAECTVNDCGHMLRAAHPKVLLLKLDSHLEDEHDTTFEEQWEKHEDEIKEELAEHGITLEDNAE